MKREIWVKYNNRIGRELHPSMHKTESQTRINVSYDLSNQEDEIFSVILAYFPGILDILATLIRNKNNFSYEVFNGLTRAVR